MITNDDNLIVSANPEVPGLALICDAQALTASLVRESPDIRDVKVDYLRYKPNSNCLARLRIQTEQGESWAYAKAFRRDATAKLAKAAAPAHDAACSPLILREAAVVIHKFPDDRAIRSLGCIGTSDRLPHFLRRSHLPLEYLESTAVQHLQYKPERRYVGKVNLSVPDSVGVKLYTASGYQLARRAIKTISGLEVPSNVRCVGHSNYNAALFFEWIHGQSLAEIITGGDRFHDIAVDLARSLRALHREKPSKLPTKSSVQYGQRLRAATRELGYLLPAIAPRVNRVCDDLVTQLEAAPAPATALIHGDLHLGQILVASNGVRLIDFDRACLAEAAEDLGTLLASLEDLATKARTAFDPGPFMHKFLDEYSRAGGDVRWSRVNLHNACRRLTTAVEPFRYRHADWPAEVEKRIDSIDRLLQTTRPRQRLSHGGAVRGRSRRVVSSIDVIDRFNVLGDHALMPSEDPLDPEVAWREFRDLVSSDRQHTGLELLSIRVVRHKPGRRCLIEYAGTSRSTGEAISLLGKIDAKPRCRRLYEQQCRLWAAGFQSEAADGICVAQPWNVVYPWNMWLQRKEVGINCWQSLQGDGRNLTAIRVARALSKLHSSGIATFRSHSLDDELAILDGRLSDAADKAPELAPAIRQLRTLCDAASAGIQPSRAMPAHRDFYPDQVLVNNSRIMLLDFDLMAAGDPAVDVGNFLAHLIEHSLRSTGGLRLYADAGHAFVEEYCRLNPIVTRQSIESYTALSLARHVSIAVDRPERRENAPRVLQTALRLLESLVGVSV